MESCDVTLVHQTLAGDENAFAALVKKYQKSVHALAWRKIGDFHIAEEITQDTFLKAYQKLSTLKDPQCFASWLYVIAARRCIAWLRKKRLWTQSLEATSQAEVEKATYSGYVIEENERTTAEAERAVVKKLLAELPESERTVVTLYYFGEMSPSEIGKFLGVSVNTIKSRLRRAQHRLKGKKAMIKAALEHFQITPYLTADIMREVSRLRPVVPSSGKPPVPWVAAASTLAVIFLMLGVGNQYFVRFQKPYSLDATSEMRVTLIEAPIVLNLVARSDVRRQLGSTTSSTEQRRESASRFQKSQTWNLPEKALARFGKGVMHGSDRVIAFSPDGTHFAAATGAGIWIYDAQTYREVSLLRGHTRVVKAIAFSPDGKTLASGSLDNSVKLWDIETGEVATTFAGHELDVEAIAFSPDGKTLAFGTWDNRVKLWDTEKGQNIATFIGHEKPPRSVAFSPDGKILASGGWDKTIKLWNTETGKNIATLTGHTRTVFSVAFSPDGKTLASGSQDGTARLWDVKTKQDIQTFKAPTEWASIHSVAFSPDGKILATGSRWDGIKLWDLETGKDVGVLAKGVQVLRALWCFRRMVRCSPRCLLILTSEHQEPSRFGT